MYGKVRATHALIVERERARVRSAPHLGIEDLCEPLRFLRSD